MTFNFLGPGLTVNVEAKVKEQIILDSSDSDSKISRSQQIVTKFREDENSYKLANQQKINSKWDFIIRGVDDNG